MSNIIEESRDNVFSTVDCGCFPQCGHTQYHTSTYTEKMSAHTNLAAEIEIDVYFQEETLFSYRSMLRFTLIDLMGEFGINHSCDDMYPLPFTCSFLWRNSRFDHGHLGARLHQRTLGSLRLLSHTPWLLGPSWHHEVPAIGSWVLTFPHLPVTEAHTNAPLTWFLGCAHKQIQKIKRIRRATCMAVENFQVQLQPDITKL